MKKLLVSLFSLIILLFIFGVVFLFSQRYIKVVEAKDKMFEIKQKIVEVKRENKELSEQVKLLKVPSYIEKIAREELGLVKPGEILFLPRIH